MEYGTFYETSEQKSANKINCGVYAGNETSKKNYLYQLYKI